MASVTYLSPGLFDMGGIARYGRYQVEALRAIVGAPRVSVLSMRSPEAGGFDEPFAVDFAAGGTGTLSKVSFVLNAALHARWRRIFWAGHLNYAPIVLAAARACQGTAIVNVYGLELWTSPPRAALEALKRCWVVSDCHATLDYAISQGLASSARSSVIWDPVDTERFKPAEPDAAVLERHQIERDDNFRVLFLGRLSKEAGHKQPMKLLEAFAYAKLPERAELVFAGSGDQVPELRRRARELGVADRVRLLGRVPDADLPSIYQAASVKVLVSVRGHAQGEGVPLTLLEAAACGVPIICGDEDGSQEALEHEVTGLRISSRSQEELVRALERAGAERDRFRQFGRAGAERIRRLFSYERFVTQHRQLLDRREICPVGRSVHV